jgi:hypothetical protein
VAAANDIRFGDPLSGSRPVYNRHAFRRRSFADLLPEDSERWKQQCKLFRAAP